MNNNYSYYKMHELIKFNNCYKKLKKIACERKMKFTNFLLFK